MSVCMSPAKNSEAIEIPFALRIRVGPWKDLLHTTDRFGRILYCIHSTQYSLIVFMLKLRTRIIGVFAQEATTRSKASAV